MPPLLKARRGQVEECEVVLLRKVLDLVDDPRESSIARVLRPREVVEETREFAVEAFGVHRRRMADEKAVDCDLS
jgi:hypothetical protein